jgi:MSHA biogenesis protein MshG
VQEFTYKGRNVRGELKTGIMEGDHAGVIADHLLGIGITPVEITPLVETNPLSRQSDWLQRVFTAQPITPMDVMLFSRQMNTLLKAGVPILRALTGLQESTKNNTLADLLQDLRVSLNSGRELSAALRRHPKVFSTFYISMVQVGEMTGMLDVTFDRLYAYLDFERDMKERITTAMRYPMFVVIAMGIAIVIINLFVIPVFARVYEGFHADLPVITKMLIGFSAFMLNYWILMLVMLAALVFGFRFYIGTIGGRYQWDKRKFRLPIVGAIIFKATLSRFARSMALTFQSGMPVLQGMDVVGMVVDNAFMRQRIDKMREGLERGESILHTAVEANVFTPMVLQMIAVGEETGDLDGLMAEVADMYEQEVKYEVSTLSAKIEPILIVSLGALVLVLALGVFLPMWDLGKAAMH